MRLPGRLKATTLGDLLGSLHRARTNGTLEVVEDSGRSHRVFLQAGLVVETADCREVHDVALLIGFGAAAVNPYLALDLVCELVAQKRVEGPVEAAIARYLHALDDGLLKVMSKMGISTVQSYSCAPR